MKTIVRKLAVLSVVVVFVCSAIALFQPPVSANPPGAVQNVNVTNSSLPVAGTVSAAQSGRWTVGIDTSSGPVLVRDVDTGARQPVVLAQGGYVSAPYGGDSKSLYDASSGSASTYVVPAGQRLVVESASIIASPPTGQKVLFSISDGPGGFLAGIPLLLQGTFVTGLVSQDLYTNTIPLRGYTAPGRYLFVNVARSGTAGDMYWQLSVVGHLVDCTAGGGC